MFCSKCGKTIRPDDQICPSCQAPIGDNRFGGIPYTSAQFTIAPGQTSFEPLNGYTRTTYTSMDDAAQEGGAPDSRTTYRPVYEGGSMPENVRKDIRAAMSPEPEPEAEPEEAPEPQARPAAEPAFASSEPIFQATQDTLDAIDEELQPDEAIDLSQFRSRPIQSAGRAGISRDVSEYIRKLEDDQSRRGGRHRRSAAPVYDDYQERAAEPEPEENYGGDYDENRPYDGYPEGEQDGAFDEFDDTDYEDYRRAGRFGVSQILKILIALVVIAAVVFGAIKWIGYIRGSQSSAPIEGVTESFYEQGVALIKTHVQSDYINARIGQYTSDGTLAMVNALTQDQAEIDALMPAEPAANDATFLSALTTIQDSIYSAITMDAMSVGDTDASAVSKSEANWQIISNAITQLESAKSAAELTAIISGQKVTVQSETPAPTQTPVAYTTLQKGDKSDDVLKLQERLYLLGYLNSDRDGAFGGKTQTAVKAFQERAGLEATGIADSNTQALLYSDSAPYAAGVASPTPSAASTPEPEVIQPVENIQANPVSNGAAATDAPVQDVPAQ